MSPRDFLVGSNPDPLGQVVRSGRCKHRYFGPERQCAHCNKTPEEVAAMELSKA